MDIEHEIKLIKERNQFVEAEKAWETSLFRLISIAVLTYIIASIVMYLIGVQNFLVNAFIPTIGYILSAQSLPFLKRWWILKYYKSK